MGFFRDFVNDAIRWSAKDIVRRKIETAETVSFNCGITGPELDAWYASHSASGLTPNQEYAKWLRENQDKIIENIYNENCI